MFGVVIMPYVCTAKFTKNEDTVSTRARETSLPMVFVSQQGGRWNEGGGESEISHATTHIERKADSTLV